MENKIQNNRCCFDIPANNPELKYLVTMKKRPKDY